MKFKIASLAIALSFVFTLHAQTPESVQKASQLLDAINMQKQYEQILQTTLDNQIQSHPELTQYKNTMMNFLNKYMGWDAIKNDFAALYGEMFTAGELEQLIAFYKTPLGQKLLQAMPELFSRGQQLGQKKVQEHMTELQSMIEAESKKARHE